MSLRILVALATILALGSSASAASIGIFSDPSCASCNIVAPVSVPTTIFINAVAVPNLKAAEFRIEGLPPSWLVINTPSPQLNIAAGDPWTTPGGVIASAACQSEPCLNLYQVTIIPTTVETNVTLSIRARDPLGNALFDCPLIAACDGPAYTKICVGGGEAFVNSQRDCTVALESTSWTRVKALFH